MEDFRRHSPLTANSEPTDTPNVVNDEVTYWEKAAQSKWGTYISEIEQRAILRASYAGQSPRYAVEIGCEGGRWSKLLADVGWQMTCVDVDLKVLSLCQSRLPTARCVLVDPSQSTIPIDTGSTQLVLCIEVPHVLPDSGWFIDEAYRVLRPGGMIVGTFFNLLSYRGLAGHLVQLTGRHDYYRLFYAAWRRTLQRRGFVFLHEEGLCWFPFRRKSDSALIPTFTAAEHYLGLRRLVVFSPWVVFVAQTGTR